jgi:hypothetical protein
MLIKKGAIAGAAVGSGIAAVMILFDRLMPFSIPINSFIDRAIFMLCRVRKPSGSTGTLYWYMTPGIVGESDLSGNLQSEYVFFDGERVARRDFPSGTVSYYSPTT